MTKEAISIRELLERLKTLSRQQDIFSNELKDLHSEINKLRSTDVEPALSDPTSDTPDIKSEKIAESALKDYPQNKEKRIIEKPLSLSEKKNRFGIKSDLEEFIGGNLINKIGIAIVVIGVSIGVKYAIDHDLISPLVRIILGYLVGAGLLAFGFRLKKQYTQFSAVLTSGAMAVFYFITYAAHSYYNLIELWPAFILLVLLTIITVRFAVYYNLQVISIIGLVGSYAVPFLFNDIITRPEIFLSYIALINCGILILSVMKNWNSLHYSAFIVTWLIFVTWFSKSFDHTTDFALAGTILLVYYLTFYLIFLFQKRMKTRQHFAVDALLLLTNSFVFLGFGYYIVNQQETSSDLTGLFTFGIAAIIAFLAFILSRIKHPDRKLLYFIQALAVLFVSIAVMIQFRGIWVGFFWLIEAAILFIMSRTKYSSFYEKLSYAQIYLVTVCILIVWLEPVFNPVSKEELNEIIPFMNETFFVAIGCILILTILYFLGQNQDFPSKIDKNDCLYKVYSHAWPILILGLLFFTCKVEIGTIFTKWYQATAVDLSQAREIDYNFRHGNHDITCFKSVWMLNYTMAFFAILSVVNMDIFRNRDLAKLNFLFNGFVILLFLSLGLTMLSRLRDSYLDQTLVQYYSKGSFHIMIRYVTMFFAAVLLYISGKYISKDLVKTEFKVPFEFLVHLSLLTVLSTELVQWIDILGTGESYKLALSILWGLYAVVLIVLGIRNRKKYLRISAIVLFSITLLKLFIYDIGHLDTISKTIVFLVLGILLLITSFLYLKYRSVLFEDEKSN